MRFNFGDGRGLVEARFHDNGGGVVEATAEVEPTVFIDRESVVFGFAQLRDRVRVLGRSRVGGSRLPGGVSTLIEDDVVIAGNVVIEGQVLMRDWAQARGCAKLSGNVAVMHHAHVCDNARIAGNVHLRDHAYVHEDVTVIGDEEMLEIIRRDVLGGDRIYRGQKEILSAVGREPKRRRYQRKAQIVRQVAGAGFTPADLAAAGSISPLPSLRDLEFIASGMCTSSSDSHARVGRAAFA